MTGWVAACGDTDLPGVGGSGRVLSAFFGLDDALPGAVEVICPGGVGLDGMPVIIDVPLAGTSLDPSAFRVVKASGGVGVVRCATLLPAIGPLERRTVLLVGDFGDDPVDPPARVEVVAPLPGRDGGVVEPSGARASVEVTELAAGASIVLAERFAFSEVAELLPESANECPRPATRQIVQVIWQGGIAAAGGAPLGPREREGLRVTVRDSEGRRRDIVPFALGDLNDRDNHLHLCLDVADEALAVAAAPGLFFDPRGDANPGTSAEVVRGVVDAGP